MKKEMKNKPPTLRNNKLPEAKPKGRKEKKRN